MKKRFWKKLGTCAVAAAMAVTGLTACKSGGSSSDSDSVDTVRIGTQEMPNDEGIAKAKIIWKTSLELK